MTAVYQVTGIAAGSVAAGRLTVGGFKHAMVSVIAGCVARRGAMLLRNAPLIQDTQVLCDLVSYLGANVDRDGRNLKMDCGDVWRADVPPALSAQIHGSVYLIPALLAAVGEVHFKEAGGCAIGDGPGGARPMAHILDVIRRFGAIVESKPHGVTARARQLHHTKIDVMDYSESSEYLTGPLVSGATKAALLAIAGVQTDGESVIKHPYRKPDVTELVHFGQRCGDTTTSYDDAWVIKRSACRGPDSPVVVELISDLSEVMTYITFAVLTQTALTIHSIDTARVRAGLQAEFELLERMGVALHWRTHALEIPPVNRLTSMDIEVTSTGIYSDHQPLFALLLLRGDRPATIRETVWKTRFSYVDPLIQMGACIERKEATIIVHPSVLRPTTAVLHAADLRAAAALVVAASSVAGTSRLSGLDHLQRGYEGLLAALCPFGVQSLPLNRLTFPR